MTRKPVSYLILILCIYSIQSLAWTPKLNSPEHAVDFFASILQKHPQFLDSSMEYQRNPFDYALAIKNYQLVLGHDSNPTSIHPLPTFGFEYLKSKEVWSVKDQFVDEMKLKLAEILNQLDDHQLRPFQEEMRKIDQLQSIDVRNGKGSIYDFLLVVPFLYTKDGAPKYENLDVSVKERIQSEIQKLDRNGIFSLFKIIQNAYYLPQYEEYKKKSPSEKFTIAYNRFYKLLENISNDLGVVDPKTKRLIGTQAVRLEEVPASIAIFRAFLGRDCSLEKIAFYAFIAGVKVYWYRNSYFDSSIPDGYVLVAPVQLEGKTIPYIITINGSRISSMAAKAITYAVGREWNSKKIAYSTYEYIHNLPEVKQGMNFAYSEKLPFVLPAAWKIVDEMYEKDAERNQVESRIYSASELIKYGRVADIDFDSDLIVQEFPRIEKQSYPDPSSLNIRSVPVFERSMLAYFAANAYHLDEPKKEHLLQSLGIHDFHFDSVDTLYRYDDKSFMTAQDFNKFSTSSIKFRMEDVSILNALSRPYTIRSLYEEGFKIDSKEMLDVISRSSGALDKLMKKTDPSNDEEIARIIKAKLQLPKIFFPKGRLNSIAFDLMNDPQLESEAKKNAAKNTAMLLDQLDENSSVEHITNVISHLQGRQSSSALSCRSVFK